MKKEIVSTSNAPAAVGPYSQAVITGDLVFCSGQIPLNPETGTVDGNSIEAQTRQCLKNLKAVLEAAGSSLQHAVKVNIYITDMKDFPAVNGIYAEYFEEPYPARACVQVAALPLGVMVEIEAVARR